MTAVKTTNALKLVYFTHFNSIMPYEVVFWGSSMTTKMHSSSKRKVTCYGACKEMCLLQEII